MKVALVIASLGSGGAERVMSLLANYWADRGDEITLITLETAQADAYPLDPRVTRVALGLVKDSAGLPGALWNNWRRVTALRQAIGASGAAVVLGFEDRTNVLVVIATLGMSVRRVVSERTDPAHREIGVWKFLRRLTYPLADAVIVQTARLLPWARRVTLWRNTARVIPNPLRALRPARAVAIAEREPLIATVGRLEHEKGHDVLIRAFAMAAREFPQWRLAIAGEGPERGVLTALADSLGVGGRVLLPGWMPVPEELLARAAFFVMSSRYEGFSNALLEAMGAGLPVISTACGGSEEMIEEGTNGYVVAVEDVDALAGAMRRLMGDAALRERFAAAAYVASQRYTPQSVIPVWNAVLNNTCAAKSATKSYSSSAR